MGGAGTGGFGHSRKHLFCHPDGRPIHPDTITEWFARLSWEAGLPPIRLHDVRHTYATAALRAGVPVKVVSERLEHSSVSFTQDTYMHVIPGMDERGAQVAAAAILGRGDSLRDHGRDHRGRFPADVNAEMSKVP